MIIALVLQLNLRASDLGMEVLIISGPVAQLFGHRPAIQETLRYVVFCIMEVRTLVAITSIGAVDCRFVA